MNQKRAKRFKKNKQFCDICGAVLPMAATSSFYSKNFEICAHCVYSGIVIIRFRNYTRDSFGNKTYI